MLTAYYGKDYDPYTATHGVSGEMDRVIETALHTGCYRYIAIAPGMRLLDVGCGGGSFLRVAKALGADVAGVEPSEHGVATCQAQGVPVFHGTLTDFLKTDSGSFDMITANHVAEHHPHPIAFFSEIKQLLAPGGKVWIAVPNANCFFSRQLKDVWHSADLPVHLHHFNAQSLRKTFERAGLAVEKIETKSENSLATSLSMLLRRRLLLPRRATLALSGKLLSKTGVLGRWADAKGQGEALLASARIL